MARERIARFEVHSWIDGIAAMLLVAIPWFGLVLEPAAEHSTVGGLTRWVTVAYPLADMMVIGIVIGLFALMGWRPGSAWLTVGAGIALMAVADPTYAVAFLDGDYRPGVSDLWGPLGALLVAHAAWQEHPERLPDVRATGLRAVALALAVQVLTAAVQVVALFHELPSSERVLTVLVIAIAVAQMLISRPRAGRESTAHTVTSPPPAPDGSGA